MKREFAGQIRRRYCRIKITKTSRLLLHYKLSNTPFDSHLSCHTYFHNYSRHLCSQVNKYLCLNSSIVCKKIILKATVIAKTKNDIYVATILAAFLNISKCSMMTRCHQSDSKTTRSALLELIKNKSLNLISRFQ